MERIAIHKDDYHFRIKVSCIGDKEFSGMVIESNIPEYKVGEVKKRWSKEFFDIYENEKVKEMDAMNKKEEVKSILTEAESIVNGDRNVQYGNPNEAFKEYSNILEATFGIKLTPAEICKVQIAIKLGRLKYKHKRDSIVDLCGYAEILNRLENDGRL
jgi:uncharacterized protein (DUF1015 family)